MVSLLVIVLRVVKEGSIYFVECVKIVGFFVGCNRVLKFSLVSIKVVGGWGLLGYEVKGMRILNR